MQVQMLLSEVAHLSSGNEPLTTADRIRFQQYTKGELQQSTVNETPTDRIITERLLLFKNIQEVQAQNQNLLKITRELAAKMEDDERKAREDLAGKQGEEAQELKKALDRYRDELKALTTRYVIFIALNIRYVWLIVAL